MKKTEHARISEKIRNELASRLYAVGDSLPTVRELARQFNCSITTIQNALAPLREEGVLESQGRRGMFVRALPAAGQNRGRVICLFPKWGWVEKKPFAAQYVLGVTLAASEHGYAVESLPYESGEELLTLRARLHRGHYAGVLWANPASNDRFIGMLAQFEAAGTRAVTSIRHFDAISLPRTVDDHAIGYDQAVKHITRRGIRRMGILANGEDDATYEPALQKLIEALRKAGVEVPTDLICHARVTGLPPDGRAILLRQFLAQKERWEGCWAFAPDALDALFQVAKDSHVDLSNRFMAVQTIRAMPIHGANLILESDPLAHGQESFNLLHQWIETGRRPTETLVPMICGEPLIEICG